MNVTCTKCGKKYVIADDKVAGKSSVKIRCKQCQSLIAVAVGPLGAAEGAVAVGPSSSPSGVVAPVSSPSGAVAVAAGAPPPPAEAQEATPTVPTAPVGSWYAMVGGKQVGPFTLKALQDKVGAGEISLRTYLWRAGMSDWKRAADVPDVSPLFASASAGATATERTQSSAAPTPAQDVAVAKETPSPEVTGLAPAAPAAVAPAAGEAPSASGESTLPDATAPQAAHDPFAQLEPHAAQPAAPSGENTKFFIARAGVNKRNPPWKIALFAGALVGIPVGITYLLSTFHVLPTVTRTTDDGREVQETFFSAEGMAGVRDLLTGEAQRRKDEAARARKAKEDAAAAAAAAAATATRPAQGTGSAADDQPSTAALFGGKSRPGSQALAELYAGKDAPVARGPKVRKEDEGGAAPVNAGGLSQEAAMKVVADKSKAFQQCVEAALHRNPNLAVGNIMLVLTVGSSGAVKGATVEPRKHEGADWAQCMVQAAKRIVFPASDGETQLELPFKVGVAIAP